MKNSLNKGTDKHSNIVSEEEWKKLPKAAREMSSFIYLVIDAASGDFPNEQVKTDLRCFKKGCHGTIDTELDYENDEIKWDCNKCENGGIIRGWRK